MSSASETTIRDLTEEECWSLLESTDLGRLGVRLGDGVDIFPVNYLVKDGGVYFASAPGSKLVELTDHPVVAFEADGTVERQRWSVVVRGTARRLGLASEIEEAGIHDLLSQTPGDKWNYVRISADTVTGRRFATKRRS